MNGIAAALSCSATQAADVAIALGPHLCMVKIRCHYGDGLRGPSLDLDNEGPSVKGSGSASNMAKSNSDPRTHENTRARTPRHTVEDI